VVSQTKNAKSRLAVYVRKLVRNPGRASGEAKSIRLRRFQRWRRLLKRGNQLHTAPARPGLIVVDATLTVVASNAEALQILTFPDRPEKIQHLDAWLARRVRSDLVERHSPSRVAGEFHSAKRTYVCRSFALDPPVNHKTGNHKIGVGQADGLLIFLLERKSNESVTISEITERFGLTVREQETVQFLLEGFTSKEIAQRMKISPNTVKAFIRLVMVKMSVSTRSGIIGKMVGPRAGLASGAGRGSSRG
jgi:DNA-binding CsgD family transcriptional regulator